jgi:sugar phosphate isomerase/epimerase
MYVHRALAMAALFIIGSVSADITGRLSASPTEKDSPALQTQGKDALFAPANLLAWCIIPYDSKNRAPAERLAMLKELGFTQYVWDWRQKHLKDFPEEIALSRKEGIAIRAAWLWIDEKSDKVGQLSESNRAVIDAVKQAQLPIDYWVGFSPNVFEGLDDPARVKKGAAIVSYLRDIAVSTGSTVALYNHGDWFGEPENEIKIIKAVGSSSVGMVYNFHHAHEQVSRFKEFLPLMLPYLKAVNLSGLNPKGPKILPLGAGTEERWMIRLLIDSGYKGPFGVLGHTEGEDVRDVLHRNLEGLKKISKE